MPPNDLAPAQGFDCQVVQLAEPSAGVVPVVLIRNPSSWLHAASPWFDAVQRWSNVVAMRRSVGHFSLAAPVHRVQRKTAGRECWNILLRPELIRPRSTRQFLTIVVGWPERHAHNQRRPRPAALSRKAFDPVMAAAMLAVASALGDLTSPMPHQVHGQRSRHTILIACNPGFVDACLARMPDLTAEPD